MYPSLPTVTSTLVRLLIAVCTISLALLLTMLLIEKGAIDNSEAFPQEPEAGIGQSPNAGTAVRTVVTISGRQILVNGRPFRVKGVGYAPTPIGLDPETRSPLYGDFFTSADSAVHNRDLPVLREMGANTIRLWGWSNGADHADLLDHAYNGGVRPIYVIATFWMGPSLYPDICMQAARTQIKADFRSMVAAHKSHPAVLMWAIGNELNAPWMYGNNLTCLFSLINEMALEAHLEEGSSRHPVVTPLVDADVINTIATYDPSMTNLDVWGVNLYRGLSFGTFFDDYAAATGKPLIILEYGTDAYDDRDGSEDEETQATYAASLWAETLAHADICSGSSIMAYSDEWWKGKYGQTRSGCPDYDPALHSTCGYAISAHPDGYANEEWWGIMRTKDNGAGPDIMEPRMVYYTLQSLWTYEVHLPEVLRDSP